MKSRNKGLKLYTSIITVLLVAVSTAQLSSIVLANGAFVYAYTNNQAQSFVNECGTEGASGINCANNGPLMQGEGLASSPVVTQFSGGRGEQGPAGPQGPPGIQGEQGPAGPKQELQLSTHFPSAVSVPAGEFRNVFATCPSGEVATGGGLFYNGGNPTALISRNSGTSTGGLNPTSWEETLFNPGPTSINIQPSVVCAKLVDAP